MLWGRRSSVQHSGGHSLHTVGVTGLRRCHGGWCCQHGAAGGRSSPRIPSLPGRENSPFQAAGGVWVLWDEPSSVSLKLTHGCLAPIVVLPAPIRGLGHKAFIGILGCKCTKRGLGIILGHKPNVLGPRRAQHPPTFANKPAVTSCTVTTAPPTPCWQHLP